MGTATAPPGGRASPGRAALSVEAQRASLRANVREESRYMPSSEMPIVEPAVPATRRRPETKEVHIRVSIPNYQYLDQVAIRYGIRSLSGAVNFLIEFHRQSQTPPILGPLPTPTKQAG